MEPLPPLDCLRFLEDAARHRRFVRAAEELGVTPPAVGHRIRMLEAHLGAELFERRRRGVYLNRRGRAYYEEGRCILLDIRDTTERHGDRRRFRGRQGRRPAAPPRRPNFPATRGYEMT